MTNPLDETVRSWRHELHRCPETGFGEHRTGDVVARVLTELGVPFERGVGGTGIVATLRAGDGDRSVGLRADMDGLPLAESGEPPYRSRHDGVMHACGHDGHMAMVLGAAAALTRDGGFDGTVRLVFQPAEEHGLGAKAMLADGLLDRFPMDSVHGLHNLPGVPVGHLHTRPGPIMASEDDFEITVHGRGGHAARPHAVVDPIVVGAEIVLALQTVVARNVDPARPAVVSCTEFVTDGARNAIPGTVVVRGDTRSFTPDVQDLLERRIRALCEGICAAHGATCTVTYTHEFEPTVNDPGCTEVAVRAAVAATGAARTVADCDPLMGSEDFGVLARAVPGCFTFIGNGTAPGPGGAPLHSRDYDFNDDALATGVQYYTGLVRSVLAPR